MDASPHYKDLLLALNGCGVEYLVVGGYAVMRYSEPCFTKDLDLWVRNSAENAGRVYRALATLGAPLAADGVTPETFAEDRIVYQIGMAPVRIDVCTSIDGVDFESAWLRRVSSTFFGVPVSVISLEDLIANKEATGRTEDVNHLRLLKRSEPQS